MASMTRTPWQVYTCSLSRVLAAIALTVTGCSLLGSHDPAPNQPAIPFTGLTQDLRIRWTADPGVDLTTGPAVIVRAYRESYVLAGLMADSRYYYPGFERAVPRNTEGPNNAVRPPVSGDPELSIDGIQTTTPIVGTWQEHIASLSGDMHSGYVVKLCERNYTTATRQPNGTYTYSSYWPRPKSPDFPTLYDGTVSLVITLLPPTPTEPDPTVKPQRGTNPSPSSDVFGGWKIRTVLHMSTEFYGSEPNIWPQDEFNNDRRTCADTAPDPYEKRRFYLLGEHPRDDFPTLPAEPGWPVDGR
ncbi:hypothetical protein BST18_07640 [Mycobacteroides abscessus subsp. bolletii]|nr:hypothetical protein BST18_07640 [Mycobacteroides abscessus subsp. bolletii]